MRASLQATVADDAMAWEEPKDFLGTDLTDESRTYQVDCFGKERPIMRKLGVVRQA